MLSRTRVTGPSFSKDTFISAPKIPLSIFNPDLPISDLKYSNKGWNKETELLLKSHENLIFLELEPFAVFSRIFSTQNNTWFWRLGFNRGLKENVGIATKIKHRRPWYLPTIKPEFLKSKMTDCKNLNTIRLIPVYNAPVGRPCLPALLSR